MGNQEVTDGETDGEADEPTKFVVFLDSFGTDDAERTEWIRENCYDGTLNAGHPYVTPKVMGEIYTGENPAVHGLPSASRYETDARTRPARLTLPEIVAESEEYGNVCNLGLPFITPPMADPPGGDVYWHSSEAMGNQSFSPPEAQPLLTIPGPAGDLSDPEENDDALFSHRMDHIRSTFETARTLADERDFDVMFISCRILDSYVHYRHTNEYEGTTDRDLLIESIIDEEIQRTANAADVFVFGDHGGTELEHVFRINRWLMEEGYLDVEIDEEFIQKSIEEGTIEDPNEEEPGTIRTVGMPGVTVNEEESVAVGDDPFSGGLTLLDGASERKVEQMLQKLEDTPHVDGYTVCREEWAGELIDECPDIYLHRNVGSFISGNAAEEMGGPEITRDGVHHPWGAFGATTDIDAPDEVTPQELFRIILEDFLGIEGYEHDPEREVGAPPAVERDDEEAEQSGREAAVEDHLRDMGYM